MKFHKSPTDGIDRDRRGETEKWTKLAFACRLRRLLSLSVTIKLLNNMYSPPKSLTQDTARKKKPKKYADKICVSGNMIVKTPVSFFKV
jgi:hypothetical protein